MSSKLFAVNPDFCPGCGCILKMPAMKDYDVKCVVCQCIVTCEGMTFLFFIYNFYHSILCLG